MQSKCYLTEDQVRDQAKRILELEDTETARAGVGQITTFNQLGFKGINDKPDGWYLPHETNFTALILETKAENHPLGERDRQELLKNCGICKKKYAHVVGILYNGEDIEVYKENEKVSVGNELLNKEAYFGLFYQNTIDKKTIYQLTKKINDALHFDFGIKNLYHRMIFTSCTLVAKRFGAMLIHDMKWELFQASIKTTLTNSLQEDLEKNAKLQILIDTYSNIQVNTTPRQQSINDFIDYVSKISDNLNSDFWNGEDVMAIFFNEFTRYKGKSEQGQVFTPDHITSFMYRLIDVDRNSVVLDAACGSGSFLVKAMCNMIKETGGVRTKQANEIKDNQLFGIEFDKEIYALACANMLIHQDGKTNLTLLDSRTDEAGRWIRSKPITKVLMNPPFENKYGCLDIVRNVLENVGIGTSCAFILPDNKLEKNPSTTKKLLKKNRLEQIIKLPKDTFQGIGMTTSIFVFTAGVPQNGKSIFACHIEEDGLETVKNQGRQDTKNRWEEIEDYWMEVIRKQSGNDTIQWIDPRQAIRYKEPLAPLEVSQADFVRSVLHYILYKKGIDEKDFKEKVLGMVLYNEAIPEEYRKLVTIRKDTETIDTSTWKPFEYQRLFRIEKGERLTKANMKEGNINYIGASAFNNGITAHIGNSEHLHDANTITVCYNGSIGSAFYQENPFWASDDVNVFYPLFEMDRYIALFFVSLFRKEGIRYQFLDKWTLEKMNETTLLLPVDREGKPNWYEIRNFIKAIYEEMA
ncbi:MAG: N-6 DNA methylase [Prevotella sp.]|nr:N-6 DNA methylase [Prevotella sp.]